MAKTKASIRKEKLKIRNKISPIELILSSDSITEYVCGLEEIKECSNVLLYANYGSEVITDKLFLRLQMMGKNIYLPKVNGDTMDFYRVFDLDELVAGTFGIREPIDLAHTKYEFQDNDVIIMPGVAFDNNGNRIGYGKGYYDKYLEDKIGLIKVAICFECQMCEEIPADKNDIKADYIITEV